MIGVHWHPTGLEISRDLTYEEVESIAFVLSRTFDASRFGLADALDHAERRWGEGKYSQLAEVTRRTEGGLMTMAWVARRVPREIRRRELTFSHHEAVAGLKVPDTEDEPDHEAQARWLQHAVVDLRLTRDELRAQIKASRSNLSRRESSEAEPSSVIEAAWVPTGRKARLAQLEAVAEEILALPDDLAGQTCLPPDVRERLRAARWETT